MNPILKALTLLSADNADHWTADGLPRVDVLSAMAGSAVTRAQVTEVAPLFTRSHPVVPGIAPTPAPQPVVTQDQSPLQDGADSPADKSTEAEDSARANARAEVQELEAQLAEIGQAEVFLRNKLTEVRKLHGEACERLSALEPVESQADMVRQYQESQKKLREQRIAVANEFKKMGVTQRMMQGKSPLDSALSRKR